MIVLSQLHHHARVSGDQPAICADEQQLTWSELAARVTHLADWLLDTGAHTIAFQLDNGVDWIITDLAILQAGLASVPLPTFFSSHQRTHVLADSGANLFLCEAGGQSEPGWHPRSTPLSVGTEAYQRADVKPRLAPGHKVTYTSGSTGTPKGVCLSETTLSETTAAIVTAMAGVDVNRHLAVLPLATLLENIAGLYAPIVRGIAIHCPGSDQLGINGSSMDFERFAAQVNETRPETMILVPQLLTALVTLVQLGMIDPSPFRFLAVGGGRVSKHLLASATAAGLPVFEGYGLSECASVVTINLPDANRPGSVGQPLQHANLRVNPTGEIEIRGPVMSGYLGQTETRGEWYQTGDLGHIDEDGFVYIDGRNRNVYITAFGRNVNPEWVESALAQFPAIAQTCVQGEARDHNLALLWLRFPQSDNDIEALVNAANAELPDYARIHAWQVMDGALPERFLTDNGRMKRADLLDHYDALIAAHYEDPLPVKEESHGLL